MIKLPFSQQEHLPIFSTSLAKRNMCDSFRFRVRGRPEKYFLLAAWRRELHGLGPEFLLFDKHDYILFDKQFWSVSLCYGFLKLFLCSSIFDWQDQFLFSENSFWENNQPLLEQRCAYLQGEIMAESCWWVLNVIISILLKKGWFSYVRASLKRDEYHTYMAELSLQSL